MLILLDRSEAVTKASVYYKVVAYIKNKNCESLNKINVKNEFLLVTPNKMSEITPKTMSTIKYVSLVTNL